MATLKSIIAPVLILAVAGSLVAGFFALQPPNSLPEASGGSESVEKEPSQGAPKSGYDGLYLLKQGSIAPLIETQDAEGKLVRSADVFKKGHGLVIVFYQGVFCSVCAHQLEGFQEALPTFQEKGYDIIAVSADNAEKAMERKGKSGLAFPVIPDEARGLISNFGVVNVTAGNIAYPTVYVLNKEGRVQYTYADPLMERLQATKLLETLSQ
jgi:peroxiredoxin